MWGAVSVCVCVKRESQTEIEKEERQSMSSRTEGDVVVCGEDEVVLGVHAGAAHALLAHVPYHGARRRAARVVELVDPERVRE